MFIEIIYKRFVIIKSGFGITETVSDDKRIIHKRLSGFNINNTMDGAYKTHFLGPAQSECRTLNEPYRRSGEKNGQKKNHLKLIINFILL